MNKYRFAVKFLTNKDKFDASYEEAKEEFETMQGLVINPNTLEKKEYPRVIIGIRGSRKEQSLIKVGSLKLK